MIKFPNRVVFVGFGAVVARPKVEASAECFLRDWTGLADVLKRF